MNNVSSFFHIIVFRFRIFLPSFSFQISSYSVNFPESRHAKFDSLFTSLVINNIWREKSISRFNKLSSSERVNNEKSDFVIYLVRVMDGDKKWLLLRGGRKKKWQSVFPPFLDSIKRKDSTSFVYRAFNLNKRARWINRSPSIQSRTISNRDSCV